MRDVGPGQSREDMIRVLRTLWWLRRVQRVVVYQTTRPARFLAVDVLGRRTRNICSGDSFSLWNFLALNVTVGLQCSSGEDGRGVGLGNKLGYGLQ